MKVYKFPASDFLGSYEWEFACEYIFDDLDMSKVRTLVREPGWLRLMMEDESMFAIPTEAIAYVKVCNKAVNVEKTSYEATSSVH